jgi:hypothetical protein
VTGEEAKVADLRKQFPLWQIWFVPWSTRPGGTFCANPWAKKEDRTGVLHADTAEHLAEYMRDYQDEHAGQLITDTPVGGGQ